jgi:uncharacterized protein YkwD
MKETYLGAVAAVVSMCAVGCGASGSSARGGGPEFPSQASLADLANSPAAPEQGEDRKTVAVDDWQPGEATPSTEAEALAQKVARGKGGAQLDAELSCTAREIGRFYAQHGAFPDQQLQAYMAGVCGSTQATFSAMVWAEPTTSVASRQAEWHDVIAKQLGQWLPASARQVGAAEISDGKTSVFAATMGQSDVEWESRSPVANDAGEVVLSGSIRSPAAFIFGLNTVGPNGEHDCYSDPRVAPPRFRITCQLDAADNAAWVDLETLPPGRVLAHGFGRVLIRRPSAALSFSAPTKSLPPETVSNNAQFAQRLLALVNERRAQAQLPPLQLAPRQSETSARLAGHYFGGEGDADRADVIALGLMAGWDIQGGTIRNGNFYSNQLSGSLDPRRWLGFMLEQPSARRVLLDPQARAIAIGPTVQAKTATIGALVSTYQFYGSDDHQQDVQRFLSQLNERRRGLGLPAVQVVADADLNKAVKSVKTTHDPEGALSTALHQVVEREQHGVEGFYIEATDVDHVTVPEALLRPQVKLAISAAHHRYPDAAWGTLTMLVVVLESTARHQTAQAPVHHVE